MVIQMPGPLNVAQPVSKAKSDTLPIEIAPDQVSLDGGPAALLQDIVSEPGPNDVPKPPTSIRYVLPAVTFSLSSDCWPQKSSLHLRRLSKEGVELHPS